MYGSRGNELLVAGIEGTYWFDPETGRERPGPNKPKDGEIESATTSPSGNWIVYQMGSQGEELWRVPAEGGTAELVKHYGSDFYLLPPTITDEGHVLVVGGPFYGDLAKIPAKPGYRF